jgi:hypothetical protein
MVFIGAIVISTAGVIISRTRWRALVVRMLLGAIVLSDTTRPFAIADTPPPSESPPASTEANTTPASQSKIDWTGIPKVDLENAALHRGVVLGPDGKPLAGASVYAASTIELLEMADGDAVSVKDLGPVRAVTDDEGRFQFKAEDLTWVTTAGERKRWEALLIATKEGVAPGWLKTWGADRSFREHWHPGQTLEVAIRTRPPATLSGQLLLQGGAPLLGAQVRLTGLMAPVEYDLEKHVPKEEVNELGLFQGIDYEEALYRPQLLPDLNTTATTDEHGRFELPGLPEGFIANIEATHPEAQTTNLRVAIRAIEPVYRGSSFGRVEKTPRDPGCKGASPPVVYRAISQLPA